MYYASKFHGCDLTLNQVFDAVYNPFFLFLEDLARSTQKEICVKTTCQLLNRKTKQNKNLTSEEKKMQDF